MAVDERRRHRLFQRLEEVLGPEEAAALMEHLPPVGWADVATKHDLAELEARMELRFEAMEAKLGAMEVKVEGAKHELVGVFRGELVQQTRTMMRTVVLANSASVVTVAGLAFAAARLT